MKPLAPKILLLIAFLVALAVRPMLAAAQDFGFEPPADATDPALPAALRDLAERVLPAYQEDDPDRYLSTLAALQMVVGDPAAAHTTRLSLQERLQSEQSTLPVGRAVVYDIYTQARAIEATESVSFADAYGQAFRETMNRLDDLDAYELEDWFSTPTEPLRESAPGRARPATREELHHARGSARSRAGVVRVRGLSQLRRPTPTAPRRRQGEALRHRRDRDPRRAGRDDRGGVGPPAQPRPPPASCRRCSSSRSIDRAGTRARPRPTATPACSRLSRIAGDPTFRPRAPFESDGDDARAVIEWIAKQSWSDGRVGMQGIGYGGFVAWSAAKRLPPALKAIATSDPMAPGIDVPSPNRIFQNSAYRWVYDILAPPDDEMANDDARWRGIDEDWYRSGRSYREFPTLPGRASAIFRSWLNHPSYDRFWQKWLPFGAEFAAIDIPVLTVTGYYSAGETAALYYFTQHHQHDANADHALLIGPFDSRSVEHGASSSVRELRLDAVARIDPNDARYAWFEHALQGAERPAISSANVNYELAGANEWRHEPSLAALESKPLRFYLAASPNGAPHAARRRETRAPMSLTETLDLRDRSDAGWRPAPGARSRRNTAARGHAVRDGALRRAGRRRGPAPRRARLHDQQIRRGLGR